MQRLLVFPCVLALSSACGGASDDGDRESASQGWRAASAALQSASADFQAQVDAGNPEGIDVACPQGGRVMLEGEFEPAQFDFTVRFEGCASEGVVVDGELSYTGASTASRVEFEYVGELSFSGAVQMNCPIDMSGMTETSVEGMNVSAQAELRGSICGIEAEVVASTGT